MFKVYKSFFLLSTVLKVCEELSCLYNTLYVSALEQVMIDHEKENNNEESIEVTHAKQISNNSIRQQLNIYKTDSIFPVPNKTSILLPPKYYQTIYLNNPLS